MNKFFFLITLITCLAGCVASPPLDTTKDLFTHKNFNAPLGKHLEAETGNTIFLEGSFIDGEAIRISKPLDMMMPGNMFIPFPVHIDIGELRLTTISTPWKYYCADSGKAAASFPGLGSVIRSGDCVGIRISLDNNKPEWVVDNSNYNRSKTIWSMSMSSSEEQEFKPYPIKTPFKVQQLKKITFDGYYGNMIHFTFEDITPDGKETKQFTFDYSGKPVLVGIKGNQFIVHQADNVKMIYEWTKFDQR